MGTTVSTGCFAAFLVFDQFDHGQNNGSCQNDTDQEGSDIFCNPIKHTIISRSCRNTDVDFSGFTHDDIVTMSAYNVNAFFYFYESAPIVFLKYHFKYKIRLYSVICGI
jgi:hypothetical protein